MNAESKAIQTAWFSITGNFLLAIIKIIAGFLGNSFALIADGIESGTDVVSSLLVLFGLKYASRPADKNHPYGHGRIEALITFLVVGFLITSASVIAYQSIDNITTPHEMPESWTLIVLGVIILWKEISYRLVMKRSRETHSTTLKADAWHHRSDAITSVAAAVGIGVALVMGRGYESADDWCALLATIFILYNAYHIFRPAWSEFMDEDIYHDLIEEIREIARQVEGIKNIGDCYIRKSGMKYHVDLHARVNATLSVKEGHDLAHRLQDTLQKKLEHLGNVLIHIEPD